jgi:hypothetical protein
MCRIYQEELSEKESDTFNMSNIFEFDCEKEEEKEEVINFNSVFDYISPNPFSPLSAL